VGAGTRPAPTQTTKGIVMHQIQTFNQISPAGLQLFPPDVYQIGQHITNPDAILLRSQDLHTMEFAKNLLAVARAGAGVNNIPIEKLTAMGVPVFNTPGANANAVKELVIAGMLLASRHICEAWFYANALQEQGDALHEKVEQGKKQFVGIELEGKTLGVIGLGAIGVKVANAAIGLGMQVLGYDPTITVKNSWQLSSQVEQANHVDDIFKRADFITFHVPLNDKTKDMLNADKMKLLKKTVIILNFSREGIVSSDVLLTALNQKTIAAYVCDFPHADFRQHSRVIALPHLGASTLEAEENCAVMAVEEIREYLETGSIKNSVNFPEVQMSPSEHYRIAIVNHNIPKMVSQISTVLASHQLNILDLVNKSRGDIAYTMLDVDRRMSAEIIQTIAEIPGVVRVRVIE
jgi:D-3-phosphoglycerate dehydrogenase